MKYPRYPAYKDSGIEWIGEIPEHWNVNRLKTVSKIQFSNVDKHTYDDEIPVLLANYTDVYKNRFITNEMEFMEATASPNEIKKFKLEAGDVLITKDSETPDDIAIPALVKSTLPNLLCGYHLAMLRPNRILDSNYLFYLYSDKKFRGKYEREANGITRFGLSTESFNDTYICTPEKLEQAAIASFLVEQTSKIDSLISKQQQLTELLKEKRQAIITHAVTKGLDPNVPMKDSGIEWIGEIPEHWDLKRVKSLFKERDERTENGEEELFSLSKERGLISRVSITDKEARADTLVGYKKFYPKDIVMNKMQAWNGVFGHSRNSTGIVSPEYTILSRIRHLNTGYFAHLFRTDLYASIFATYARGMGTAFLRLNFTEFGGIYVPVPPDHEQDKIMDYLNRQNGTIDLLITKQEQMIKLLEEHKSSLVSNAVTGKIDVRNLVQVVTESAGQTP